MVITRLIGGLGNQLFQYAAARRIAHFSGLPLRLDVSAYRSYDLHRYGLAPFNLKAEIATAEDLRPYQRRLTSAISRRAQQYLPVRWRRFISEPHFHFAPEILEARGSAYLSGYWQSEQYFTDIEPLIRDEIRVVTPPGGRDVEVMAAIESCTSVSMHVRRGDYVGHETHGVCSPEYYRDAMAYMRDGDAGARFFLFTDDPTWARMTFGKDPAVILVDHNGPERDYEDFRLMTLCRHHIIANSTFSWWVAWLAGHSDKLVIAPRRWFAIDTVDSSDLVPERWIRL